MSGKELGREYVEEACRECDRLGREGFLEKYGRSKAKHYFLKWNGEIYDSKAIYQAAHRLQFDTDPRDLAGGKDHAAKWLLRLGFEVEMIQPLSDPHAEARG